MELMKIVVRYKDGRIAKGYTDHFDPDRPFLRVYGDAVGDSPIRMAIARELLRPLAENNLSTVCNLHFG